MMKKLLLFIMLISLLLYTGCGGGGGGKGNPYGGCIIPAPEDNEVFSSLGDGRVVDISRFNISNNIYTTITALPEKKWEGNGYPPIFTGTLSTTTSVVESRISNITKNRSARSLSSNSISGQAKVDLFLRQEENTLLAKRTKQLSKKISGINFAVPSPIEVGTAWNDVKIVIATSPTTVDTTCQHISAHAYFFVDNRDTITSSLLTEYGTAFDTIYTTNREKFGTENDVDENEMVIIVFTQAVTDRTLGYFYGGDKFSNTDIADSNEGDIFYLTTDNYDSSIIKGTLAHEFQHMIYFDEHHDRGVINTQTWLNEALSQAAEYYNNYLDQHHAWIRGFLANNWPGGGWFWLSLTYWTPENYGYGAIFIRYLIDQYGDTAIKNMCSTSKVGIAAVEAATGEDFNTIFFNFSRALVLSGTGATADSRYNFSTLNLQEIQQTIRRKGLIPSGPFPAGDGGLVEMYPYEIYFTEWTGEFGTMKLSGDLAGDVFGIDTL